MFQRKKKGFTLIEMLAVIALIAILVSITIPVIEKSVVKSAAAANAANLRSIEGKLSTMRVENPQAFDDATKRFGVAATEFLDTYSLGLLEGEWASAYVLALFGAESVDDLLSGNDFVGNYFNYHIYHQTADENGVITIPVDPQVQVTNVPTAKECKVGNMNIDEGTPMTIAVSDVAIVATYEFDGKAYTKEDLAIVAETGKFDGQASGGLAGEQVDQTMSCKYGGQHSFDQNTTPWKCTNGECGHVLTEQECPWLGGHAYNDQYTCTMCGRNHDCDTEGHIWNTSVSPYKCKDCNAAIDKYTCALVYGHDRDDNGKCKRCADEFGKLNCATEGHPMDKSTSTACHDCTFCGGKIHIGSISIIGICSVCKGFIF